MSHKLVGVIFILFGMGLLGESAGEVYRNSISVDYESIKSIGGILLGIASCIYGYKRMKNEYPEMTKQQ